METLGAVSTLVESYCDAVRSNGLAECARWPYAFAKLADGTKIPSVLRSYLRRHPETEALAPKRDPFALSPDFFNQPFDPALSGDPLVSRLVHAVWEDHPELRAAFPDPGGEHREALATWIAENRLLDFQLDAVWVRPVEESLRRLRGRSAMVSFDPWLATLRRVGKPLVPKSAKTWLRELVHPRLGRGDRVQRTTRALLRMLPFAVKHRLRSLVLPVGATFPQRPTTRPAPSVLRFGFHEYDQGVASTGLAWIGEEATIRVPQADLGPVRVQGSYSPGLFLRSGGSPQTKLEVLVNGASIGTAVLEREGPFDQVFHAPNGSSGTPVTVSLRTNQSFVPARVGLGEDLRRLSLEIGRVDLGSRTLVDFTKRSGRPEEVSPLGINVVGYLRSELGIGESARLGILAADAAGVPVSLVDFSEGCSSRLGDDRYAHRLSSSNPQPVNIFYVNADQFPLLYATLGPGFFQNRYNIGFWLWELPEFPSEWLGSFGLVDEVWAPSRFCQDAIAEKSPVPVYRMPIPIQVDLQRRPRRSDLGLPEDRFLFLTMWDMHSFQGRKNPEAVLDAYLRAFSGRRDVGLVIKTMNTSTYPEEWARFKQRIDEIGGITVIDAVLTRQQVWELEAACDCFVSLHRSEGYGIVLAECMALGKPVIATAWSGNLDFTREDNSCLVRYRLVTLDRDHGPYRRGANLGRPRSRTRRAAHAPSRGRRGVPRADRRRRRAHHPRGVLPGSRGASLRSTTRSPAPLAVVKVCIDAQAALSQRAGVSRYVRSLVDALAALDGDDAFVPVVFSVRPTAPVFAKASPARIPIPRRALQAAWRVFDGPTFDALAPRADLFHFPDFVVPPLRKGRCVVTIHDVVFHRFPETLEARNRRHLQRAVPRSIERADAVIADSHFVAGELRAIFPEARDRIVAVPLGLGAEWHAPPPDVVASTLGCRGIRRPYVLTVGTLEPRKNHALLIDAFERLGDPSLTLVIVGANGWKHEGLLARIASSRAASRIVRLPFVPDDELRALYAGCAVFAFPSRDEGFGFPPLEAMACGAPVVAAARGALPEVVGDGGIPDRRRASRRLGVGARASSRRRRCP